MVEEKSPDLFIEKATGEELERVVAKMSKSLKNVINPDEIINEFGADSMRMYEMFMGPLEVSKPWATTGLSGVYRFLDRIWRLYEDRPLSEEAPSEELLKTLHKTIKKVTYDTNTLNFNTGISQMMVLVNELYKVDTLPRIVWEALIKMLSPYVPHLAEELWEKAGHEPSLANVAWPAYDEKLTIDSEVEMVFQINGKVRAKEVVEKGMAKDELLAMAKANEKIVSWLEGKTIVKEIVVQDKLVNIVIR
jgi:leucyl-tRNA synthetase